MFSFYCVLNIFGGNMFGVVLVDVGKAYITVVTRYFDEEACIVL